MKRVSVPEIADLRTEPAHVLKAYGADDTQNADKAAFAQNCILARRLIERGVRFVQLHDWGWDFHGTGAGEDIKTGLPIKTLIE